MRAGRDDPRTEGTFRRVHTLLSVTNSQAAKFCMFEGVGGCQVTPESGSDERPGMRPPTGDRKPSSYRPVSLGRSFTFTLL